MEKYMKSIKREWKQISFPDKKENVKKTSTVVITGTLLGGLVAAVDYMFQAVINFVM